MADLENGRRRHIALPELMVLAKAFDVAPAELLFSADEDGLVEMLPGEHRPIKEAVAWFTAVPPCDTCGDRPPTGFICAECGRGSS